MKTILATLLTSSALVGAGFAAFIYSGAFSIAATDPHWPATYWVMEKARMRSIQMHAAGLTAPSGYNKPTRIAGAMGHFSEHCATCHGAPGTKRNEAMEGMYPLPPNLADAAKRYTAGELFWILKNGIKMSGMPSMASDGDEMLWSTVAFLQKLPIMSDDEYNELWMASQAQGEMNMDHGSMNMQMDHSSMTMQPAAVPASPAVPSKE